LIFNNNSNTLKTFKETFILQRWCKSTKFESN